MKQKLLLLVAVLCSAFSVQAATITYQLTTHVDGRTLTGTATVDEGASLQANMPQNLWRGYTTYKYYSDQALTQEITTAPAEDATVYVDYVFDPPFLMSNDNKTVWNYIRNYVEGGSTQRYLYYDKTNKRVYQKKGTSVTSNQKIQWAFYGDGYDFNIKLNDSSIDNPWLIWGGGEDRLQIGAKQQVGWQIYANAAKNDTRPGGTVCIGRPDNGDLMYMPDLGIALKTQSIDTSVHHFDSHHQLVSNYSDSDHSSDATTSRNKLWSYAFFASTSSYTQNIWHVTYRIQKQDGTWYNDIVIQKSSSNLTPSWPVEGFTEAEGCKYDYFYTDATFTEKFEGAMPNDRNSILYIKEKAIEYLTNAPWKTLVIPFSIDNLPEYFGADYEGVPAVDVLEFQEIQDGVITKVGEEDFYSCKLVFNPVDKIEAYKPYFFRVNRADEDAVNELYAAEGKAPCDVTTVNDEANPGISISMEGTLEPNGVYMDAEDGLHFFFGYNDRNETYNFYRVTTTIPKNRCWFYVNDNRGSDTKKLNVTFDMDGVTGIGQVMANTNTANDKVYNLNGQQVAGKLQKGIYIVNGKKVLVK